MTGNDPVISVNGVGAILDDQLNTYLMQVDNLTILRGFTGVQGIGIGTRGTAAAGDGGAGFFYWAPGGGFMDNGTTVIVPNGTTTGAWIREGALGPFLPLIGGTITGNLVVTGGNLYLDVDATATAAGTDYASAYGIQKPVTVLTTVGGGTGAALPAWAKGGQYRVLNRGLSTVAIYPDPASQIEGLGAGAAETVMAGSGRLFIAGATDQWWAT